MNDLNKTKEQLIRELEALRVEGERYRRLVEATVDWVWAIDKEGIHTFSNQAVKTLLGYEVSEIVGTSAFSLMHPEDRERILEMVTRSVEQKVGWRDVAIRWLHKDDSTRFFESTAQPILDVHGNLIGFNGIDRDVTERKQVEEELEEKRDRLEELVEERTTVLQLEIAERKRAEEELRESEKKFRTIFETSKDAISITTLEGEIPDANQALLDMLGFDRLEDIQNLNVGSTYVDPERRPKFIARLLEHGFSTDEYQLRRKDGTEITVIGSSTLLRDKAGQPLQIINIQHDITERKRTEEALKASQESYQDLYDNAPDMFVSVDAATADIIQCNQTLLTATGYTMEEVVGRPIFDLYHPDCREYVRNKILPTFVQTGEVRDVELQLKKKDGSKIEVSLNASAVRDDQGAILHSRSVWRDITERKQMEERLRQSEERLDLAMSVANDGIWDWRVDNDVVHFDSRYYTMAGYEPNEFPSVHEEWGKRVHPDDFQQIRLAVEQYLDGDRETYDVEYRFLRKDGDYMWIRARGKIVAHDRKGNPARFVGTHSDVTERKRAEERIVRLNRLQEELFGPSDFDEKLKQITDGVVNIFDADFSRIWIIKPGDRCNSGCFHAEVTEGPHVCRDRDRCLHLISSSGRYTHIDGEVHRRVPFGCYKIGRIASGEEPRFITNDVVNDPRVHDHEWDGELGLVSFAGYRLLSEIGEAIGVLSLFSKQVITPDENALIEGIANTTAQIIQMAKAERALRESEAQYRELFEGVDDAIAVHDLEANILDVNEAACRRLGYSREELLHMKTTDLDDPDYGARFKERLEKQLADGKLSDITGAHITKDGRRIDIDVNSKVIAYQGEPAVLAVVRDITERKQMEQALRESEERYRILSELISDYAYSYRVEPDGSLVAEWITEQAYTRVTGYDFHKEVGVPFSSFHPDDQDRARQDVLKVLEGHSTDSEYRYLTADGEERWLNTRRLPIWDEARERVVRLYGATSDITERKLAEEKVRESEDNLTEAQRIGRVGNWVHYLDRGFLYWSDELFRIFGRKRQKLDSEVTASWIHPDDRERLLEASTTYIRDNTRMDIEYQIVRPDGTVRFVHSQGEVIVDEQGRPIKTLGTVQDVTERKRAEEALRESEERYRNFFDNSLVGLFRAELSSGLFIDMNETGARMQGRTREEIVGKVRSSEMYRDQAQRERLVEILRSEGEAHGFEAGLTLPNGKDVVFSISVRAYPEKNYLEGVVIDITERKQAEEALAAERNLLRTLIDNMPDFINIKDTESRFVVANLATAHQLGAATPNDVLGKTDFDFHLRELAEVYYAREQRIIQSGQPEINYEEYWIDQATGVEGWALFSKVPVRDRHGMITHIVNIGRDITERKQAEQRERELMLERERIQILADFITKASHEFRTPLSIIQTNAFLLRKIADPDNQKRRLQTIEGQVKHIAALVDDMTTLSRLDGGEGVLILKEVNLNDVVRAVHHGLQPMFREKQHEVTLELIEKPLQLQGDSDYLQQAMRRILENAIRYTPSGGSITLRSDYLDDNAVIEIIDAGMGISEDDLPHIFERFYRADTAGTTRGFGLGLPIARAIIEKHHGRIEAESKLGQGSTVRIYLPTI